MTMPTLYRMAALARLTHGAGRDTHPTILSRLGAIYGAVMLWAYWRLR